MVLIPNGATRDKNVSTKNRNPPLDAADLGIRATGLHEGYLAQRKPI